MKKHLLNPHDVMTGISLTLVVIFFGTMFIGMWMGKVCSTNNPSPVVICVTLLLIVTTYAPAIYGFAHYWYFRGFLYLYDDYIVLKKGRKKVQFDISQIRRIEIKYDLGKRGRQLTRGVEHRYAIVLCGQKEALDFLITNPMMLSLIRKHNLRFTPSYLRDRIYPPENNSSQDNP